MRRASLAAVSCLAVLCLGAAGAGARSGASLARSPLLWATVDVCHSSTTGDVVGLRGSMPGSGSGDEEMYMIFHLQYLDDGRWHYVKSASSGPLDAGSAQFRSRQAGLNFKLAGSTASGTVLRGVVRFEWRNGVEVVHQLKRRTSGGRVASAGSSPPGFSAAHCRLS